MQEPTFPRISAVIITHNESENIRACITSLQAVADEIVVVDAFSDDATVDICVEMGVRVVQRKWQGYSANKNHGNEHASNDWILSIDADEVLSEELIENIKKLQPQKGKVYSLDRISNFCGQWIRYSGWYPDWKIRIFNRTEVHWEGDYVHEHLQIPSHFVEQKLSGKLWHYSYKSMEDHLQRIERYSDLAAQELFAGNKRPSPLRRMLSPYARFWNTFFFKLGFLDGRNGYIISKRNDLMVRKKYHKLEGLYEQKSFET